MSDLNINVNSINFANGGNISFGNTGMMITFEGGATTTITPSGGGSGNNFMFYSRLFLAELVFLQQ